jgi:AAHS family benzoate transporter-like MFS transporter
VFGPWLGGILIASGLSSSGFLVFAVAGLLGAAMVTLVRRKGALATESGSGERTPVSGSRSA